MKDGHKVYTGPRVLKLGVRSGMRALLIGLPTDGFADEAREMGAEVTEVGERLGATAPPGAGEGATRPGPEGGGYDLIFLGLSHRDDLPRIAATKPRLSRNGALWTLRPKGVKEITEHEVREAGLSAGLVDVKVVAFSPTHSAQKFVYRLKDR
ncbi:MAG TPA: hypothetical protein VG245_02275 [Candidatus Dormibacteraeota bacterium]|nr:hypothetical protein [Candidatus Dormibacteraeota bacterium]